jgi:hypothetical protein
VRELRDDERQRVARHAVDGEPRELLRAELRHFRGRAAGVERRVLAQQRDGIVGRRLRESSAAHRRDDGDP